MRQLRFCYHPHGKVDTKLETYQEPDEDLYILDWFECDLHLWVEPGLLFFKTQGRNSYFGPALDWYSKVLEYCHDRQINVIAKTPSWSNIWWYDPKTGIDPESFDFLHDCQFQADLISNLMFLFPTIRHWVIGNEPLHTLVKEGFTPVSNPTRWNEDERLFPGDVCADVMTEIINRLQPPLGLENIYGPALEGIGSSIYGIMEPDEFIDILWPKVGGVLEGMAINAYPLHDQTGWNRFSKWEKAYKALLVKYDFPIIPSEQGIREDQLPNRDAYIDRYKMIISASLRVFNTYSMFQLKATREGGYGLIRENGIADLEIFDLLQKRWNKSLDDLEALWSISTDSQSDSD